MSMRVEGSQQSSYDEGRNVDKTPNQPKQKDIDDFNRMMEKGGSGGQNSQGSETSSQGNTSDLSSLFSSLMSGQGTGTTVTSVNAAQGPVASGELMEICDKIVDKILVSEPRLDGSKEVLITLKDSSTLQDTTIRLTRDLNGMLFVNISTSDNNSYQKLITARAILEEKLEQTETNALRIDIVYNDGYVDEETPRPHEQNSHGNAPV